MKNGILKNTYTLCFQKSVIYTIIQLKYIEYIHT